MHESSTKVYLWSIGKGETKFVQKHLTRAEVWDIWYDYSRGAKLYRLFGNSWEIIPMLVPNDVGEESPEDEDDGTEDDDPPFQESGHPWGEPFVHSM